VPGGFEDLDVPHIAVLVNEDAALHDALDADRPLDQALTAAGGSDTLREVRLRSCRYFISTELPKARQQLAFVKSLNDEAVQFADALF